MIDYGLINAFSATATKAFASVAFIRELLSSYMLWEKLLSGYLKYQEQKQVVA